MTAVVFLDSSPLGLITNPQLSPGSMACSQWIESLLAAGRRVVVPELADYEVRRELLRARKMQGVAQLDSLAKSIQIEYLPLTTAAMRKAAEFWAIARQQGQPTAADSSIDGDVILAAQAATAGVEDFIVATTNTRHLSRFVPADTWQNIKP